MCRSLADQIVGALGANGGISCTTRTQQSPRFALVERDGRYLMLQRGQEPYRGHWELPGGFVEAGERPDESVQREIFEETGLQVETPGIIGAYNSHYGDDGKWTIDVAFHCQASSGDLKLSADSSEAAWVTIEQMPPLAFAGERSAPEEFKQSGLHPHEICYFMQGMPKRPKARRSDER